MSTKSHREKEDPRVMRTRILIWEAFTELLAEKGFQALSVQDITGRAGIHRGTFYAHFPDKYALLDFTIRETFRQEIKKRMLDACHYSEENLHALIVMICEFLSGNSSYCSSSESQFESLIGTQVRNQLQEILQTWLKQVDTQTELQIATTAASWAIYGLVLRWSREKNRKKPSPKEFADQILPLIEGNLKSIYPSSLRQPFGK